ESLLLVVDPENSRTSPPAVDSRCAGPENLPVLQLPTIPWQPPSRDPLTNRLTVDGDGHNEPFGLAPSMVPGTALEVRGIGQGPTEWGVENDAAAESQVVAGNREQRLVLEVHHPFLVDRVVVTPGGIGPSDFEQRFRQPTAHDVLVQKCRSEIGRKGRAHTRLTAARRTDDDEHPRRFCRDHCGSRQRPLRSLTKNP